VKSILATLLPAVVPLGDGSFAEPDIHSLPRALVDRHRRLSLCSLPVLKQFEGSLGRFALRRSVGNRQDLAVCALCDLAVVFPPVAVTPPPLSGDLRKARSPVFPGPQPANTQRVIITPTLLEQ
jgi:hypothetical protein